MMCRYTLGRLLDEVDQHKAFLASAHCHANNAWLAHFNGDVQGYERETELAGTDQEQADEILMHILRNQDATRLRDILHVQEKVFDADEVRQAFDAAARSINRKLTEILGWDLRRCVPLIGSTPDATQRALANAYQTARRLTHDLELVRWQLGTTLPRHDGVYDWRVRTHDLFMSYRDVADCMPVLDLIARGRGSVAPVTVAGVTSTSVHAAVFFAAEQVVAEIRLTTMQGRIAPIPRGLAPETNLWREATLVTATNKEELRRALRPLFEQSKHFEFSQLNVVLRLEYLHSGAIPPAVTDAIKPRWDAEQRELYFGGTLCKKFRQPAPNQECILNAFEEVGWPPCLDDPIPPNPGVCQRDRLSETVRSLNGNSDGPLWFELAGTGQSVLWKSNRPQSERKSRSRKAGARSAKHP